MEEMFQTYKDVAEFRMIYIREAHAADGCRPVGYATEMGIMEHTSIDDRCTTAQKLIDDKSLSMSEFKDSDEEPELTVEQIATGDMATEARIVKEKAAVAEKFEAISGSWTVTYEFSESAVIADVEVYLDNGTPAIAWTTSEELKSWESLPQELTAATDIRFNGTQLVFHLPAGEIQVGFAGEFDGKKSLAGLRQRMLCRLTRSEALPGRESSD